MFNSNMLLSENYRKFTQPSVKVNVEESYFSIATKAIQEMSDCSLEQEKIFLAAVLEAGDSDYLLHESFEQFKANVKKIIDKFLELIKSLAARFLTNMNKIVRSDNYLKNVPVVIFSSLVNDEMRRKGEQLGADAQLSKPEIGQLVEAIDGLVNAGY